MKSVCRECKEIVKAMTLTFAKSAKVRMEKDDKPFYLTGRHPPKEGYKVGEVVSQEDGRVLERHCAGSLRPPL